MENKTDKTSLIVGDEFENALLDAANVKKENLTSVKNRNKDNYSRFYDIMLMSRRDVQAILDKRKKDRADDENNLVKEFKKETSQTYRQICNLLAQEEIEEGEQTNVEKLVQKIAPLVKLMEYTGHHEIEDEFRKYGIVLDYERLGDMEDSAFENEEIENSLKEVFENGKNLKYEVNRNNDAIKTKIFETAVPVELQFEKSTNPSGIRSSDFCKLVDLKTKMLMAQSDEAKEKIDEKANDMAGQCEFDNARNKLIQSKLIEFQTQDS